MIGDGYESEFRGGTCSCNEHGRKPIEFSLICNSEVFFGMCYLSFLCPNIERDIWLAKETIAKAACKRLEALDMQKVILEDLGNELSSGNSLICTNDTTRSRIVLMLFLTTAIVTGVSSTSLTIFPVSLLLIMILTINFRELGKNLQLSCSVEGGR